MCSTTLVDSTVSNSPAPMGVGWFRSATMSTWSSPCAERAQSTVVTASTRSRYTPNRGALPHPKSSSRPRAYL